MGSVHHPIRTRSPDAQRAFDHGLAALYGFNYDVAMRGFGLAYDNDPDCAMCVWGFALAVGPNINERMKVFPMARHMAVMAAKLAQDGPPVEQALTKALLARYGEDFTKHPGDRDALDRAYADAMRAAASRFPDDDDLQVLLVEALYITVPLGTPNWPAGAPASPVVLEQRAILEKVLARAPDHIGAIHFYIHLMEGAPDQERALAPAERLIALAPRAGHLIHMASHLYMRMGRYADATRVNRLAIAADDAWLAEQLPGTMYEGFAGHPWHFLWATLLFEGASAEAEEARIEHLHRMHASPFHALDPMGMDMPAAQEAIEAARFGRWDKALALPDPTGPQGGIAVPYARGLARLAHGELDAATAQLAPLRSVRTLTNEQMPARVREELEKIGNAAAFQLEGAIAVARGDRDAGIVLLQRAIEVEDTIEFGEPPFWILPARQRLGAVLLAAGRAADAEAVYRADLAARPENGWSLHGLAAALDAQKKPSGDVKARFAKTWARADVTLTSSVF
ncbi:MAG TPA: hypothetical protein VM261_23090 [Kofleriaceae bacterium]|nr:hypothetical protein [Kofleriaceae bacterium]